MKLERKGPTARPIPARGSAPGDTSEYSVRAESPFHPASRAGSWNGLSALKMYGTVFPGRCPGLVWFGPLAHVSRVVRQTIRRVATGAAIGSVGCVLNVASFAQAGASEPESLSKLNPAEQAELKSDPALLRQYLQLAHAQQLLLGEARKAKWEERPEVKVKLERAREKALAESWLQSIADPPPEFPSEDELKAAWEERKASFATPRQYRLAQIFIASPKGANKGAVQKAEAKLAAVKKRLAFYKEDFATIARSDSEDKATAAAGGEIGWLSDAQIQPELRAAVTRLLQHEVSPPLRLNDGWHLLKCLDKRKARMPALEEVRPALVKQLRAEKAKANSEAYVAELLRAHPPNGDESAPAAPVQPPPK